MKKRTKEKEDKIKDKAVINSPGEKKRTSKRKKTKERERRKVN